MGTEPGGSPATPRRFITFEEARDAFNIALPDYRCPACGDEHLALLGEFDDEIRTRIELKVDGEAFPQTFVPTLVLICDNCGHVSTFAEDGIMALAKRKRDG